MRLVCSVIKCPFNNGYKCEKDDIVAIDMGGTCVMAHSILHKTFINLKENEANKYDNYKRQIS